MEEINLSLVSPAKIRDVAIRLWLVAWHFECDRMDYFEPVDRAAIRIAAMFKDGESEHFGDCTKQPQPCLRCFKDEYEEKARKLMKEEALDIANRAW